ncbi:MAG: HAMP domain-containing histidine kinase [Gammaproteobacteria bacterium]|nr:MAG: HAMP domain-containing histidine kinase [Gammaproteobacteria bacterium]
MIRRFLRRVAHSLSARLLGIFLLTSLVYGFASRYAVELVLDTDYLREMVGSHVSLHTTYFLRDLGIPPSIERARAITAANPLDIRLRGPDLDWASSPDFPRQELLDFQPSRFFADVDTSFSDNSPQQGVLKRMSFARYQDHSYVHIELHGYEIMVVSPKIVVTPAPNWTTPLIGLISILVLAGCFFSVTWLIRPIEWIKEGARRIGQGDLDYRIPATRSDDLGELTVDINRMADDVQGMLEAKQQMLLAISHELRSPLTRTKVALEFIDDEVPRKSIQEDVEEMERLINDLLESERLNTRHSKLQLGPVDLTTLVRELVGQEFLAEQAQLTIKAPDAPVPHEVDETRIRLLVKNLIDNALCYRRDDGDTDGVEIEVADRGDEVVVRVTDHGPGMSPEDAARATEPFYRADPARCRDTGGIGLGLYLCRRIAEAHGGVLEIDSVLGQGTRVSVHLPRHAAA